MTPLDVVWVAVLAFVAGAAVGYRLARAVMARFVADAMKAIERPVPAPASDPPEDVLLRPPAVLIRPTRSPFGARRHKLPLA